MDSKEYLNDLKDFNKEEKLFCTCCGNHLLEVDTSRDCDYIIHIFECPQCKSFSEEERKEFVDFTNGDYIVYMRKGQDCFIKKLPYAFEICAFNLYAYNKGKFDYLELAYDNGVHYLIIEKEIN